MSVKRFGPVALALAGLLSAGPALANMCVAENLSCPTKMPVGGFCECTAHGQTKDGTVMEKAPAHKSNSTAGGCGAQPNAPGCK
jgi:hypothetical protein